MFPVLTLFLAVLCPHVFGFPGGTTEPEMVSPEELNNRTTDNILSVAHSNTDFAFSLYKLLATQNPGDNVIFSPFSVSVALALLALGARGTTQIETLQGLKFNLTQISEAEIHQGFQLLLSHLSKPGTDLQLNTSTAMFVNQKLHLLENFQQEAKTLYTAEAFPTDFQDPPAAEKLINDYVKQKTQGKIQDLVKNLDPKIVMVLVNCLFFKAKWRTPFDPRDTFTADFHLNESRVEKVPMMSNDDMHMMYFRDEAQGITVVQLPYSDNRACALFVLPDQGRMAELEAMLNPSIFQHWRDSLSNRMVKLFLPKFSISGDYNLKEVLPKLGISEIFSVQADLSGFTGNQNLHVSEYDTESELSEKVVSRGLRKTGHLLSFCPADIGYASLKVVHKAVLDVAENGTEAAAATGIKMYPLSGRISKIVIFNRPFLVALFSEDTQGFLFLGKVTNPVHS